MMFFERLFKKDVSKNSPDLSLLSHPELEEWLVHRIEKESVRFDFDLEGLMKDLGDATSILASKIEEMNEVSIKGGGQKKKIIEFNKNNMVKQVRKFLENLVLPADYTYEELLDFHQKSEHSLRVSLENSLKSYQYVRVPIPISRDVIELVKEIKMLLDGLHNQLEEKKKVIHSLTAVQEIVKKLNEKERECSDEKEMICALDEKIKRAKTKIDTIDEELEEIKGTLEWEKYSSLLKLEEELVSAKERIRSQLNNQVSPLVKVLKRLEKQCKSKRHHLSESHAETLKELLTTPHTADDPEPFFKYLSELLARDNLGVNPQKMKKITSHLQYLILSHTFEEQQRAYRETSLELSKLREKIRESEVQRKIKEIERVRDETSNTLKTLQTERKRHVQKAEQLSTKREELEEELKEKITKLQESNYV